MTQLVKSTRMSVTWSAVNWSPPNAATQGLMPPVPTAMNSKANIGPILKVIFVFNVYVASNQTFAFISWTLINSDKRSAVSGSWNPGTSTLIQEGAVLT